MLNGISVDLYEAKATEPRGRLSGGGEAEKRRLLILGDGRDVEAQRVAVEVLNEGSFGLWFFRTFLASRFVQVEKSDLGDGKLLFVNVKSLVKRTSIKEDQIRGATAEEAAKLIGDYRRAHINFHEKTGEWLNLLELTPWTQRRLELGAEAGQGSSKTVWRAFERVKKGENKPCAFAKIKRDTGFRAENALAKHFGASPYIVEPAKVLWKDSNYYWAEMPLYDTDGYRLTFQILESLSLRQEALVAMVDVAKGLKVLHEEGFVHRDIKPANLFFRRNDGRLTGVVGDLGLVRHGEAPSRSGTRRFMARDGSHGFKSGDIWGLGQSLREMFLRDGRIQALARQMQARRIEDRPTIDTVIERLEDIARQSA